MKTTDLVKNTGREMHITLNFGALNYCGLAHRGVRIFGAEQILA